MISLIAMQRELEDEISMSEQCVLNLLERLNEDIARINERKLQIMDLMERFDEDIARINERKLQLMDEFAARRRNLEQLIGIETSVAVIGSNGQELDYNAR